MTNTNPEINLNAHRDPYTQNVVGSLASTFRQSAASDPHGSGRVFVYYVGIENAYRLFVIVNGRPWNVTEFANLAVGVDKPELTVAATTRTAYQQMLEATLRRVMGVDNIDVCDL